MARSGRAWLAACAVVAVARPLAFRSTAARESASERVEIERLPAAEVSGARLLAEFVLRDVPVVLTGAVAPETLAALAAKPRGWDPGRTPAWFGDVLGSLAAAADGAASFRNESTRRTGDRWGCRGSAKQCQVAWWHAGTVPDRGRAGEGATVHTDAVCAPAWALQVAGSKRWTFAKRTPAERGVPLGDEFFSDVVYTTDLAPGELMVFYNGWHPHATENHLGSTYTASVHGVLDFPDLGRRLWGPEAVGFKSLGDPFATPSTRLLGFCPDVRRFGGFERREAPARACAAAASGRPGSGGVALEAWDKRSPVAHVDVGYMAAPALGDVDGDSDLDLAVGDGAGRVSVYVADGGAFVAGGAVAGADALAAPALGDLTGDGAAELVVGGYDGSLRFFDGALEPLRPPLRLPGVHRAAPLLLDVDGDGDLDLVVGAEDEAFRCVPNSGNATAPAFAAADAFVLATPWGGRGNTCAVARLAAGSVAGRDVVLVGDGHTFQLRPAALRGAALVDADLRPSPLAAVRDVEAISDQALLEVGGYPAPALGDVTGDGVADLLVGEHYGTVLFFDGASPVLSPPGGGDDDDDDDS